MKTLMNCTAFVCIIFYMVLPAGCERVYAPVGESRFVVITVLTPDEQPADSIVIHVREKSTGKEFDICHPQDVPCIPKIPGSEGTYVIFGDELKDQIGNKAEILVEGKRDTLFFTEKYIIGRKRSVFKIAGPDAVYLQPDEPE